MLQTKLNTVLMPPDQRAQEEAPTDPNQRPDAVMDPAIDDQLWIENGFDMHFWTNLEEHPLLAWPGELT